MGRNNRGKGKKKKKGGGGGKKNCGGRAEDTGRRETDEEEEDVSELLERLGVNKTLSFPIGTRVKCPVLYDAGYDRSRFPWDTGTVVDHSPEEDFLRTYDVLMDGTSGALVRNTEGFFEELDDEIPMEKFKIGSRVECQLEEAGRWFPGVVIQRLGFDEAAYRIGFDYGRECNFWGPPAAIRACNIPLPKNRFNAQELRFRVGDRVECSLQSGYVPGTIIKTWYGGERIFENGHKVPYQIQLDVVDKIYAPFDSDEFIRKCSVPPPDCCICFDNEQSEDNIIVHECACRGSQNGFVHIGCLVKWAKSKLDFDVEPEDDESYLRCETCRQGFRIGSTCHKALTTMLFNETKHLDISNKWSKIAISSMSMAFDYEEEYDAAENLLLERISRIRSRIKDEEKSHGVFNQCWARDLSNFFRDLAIVYSHKGSLDEMKEAIEESLTCLEHVVGDDDDEYGTFFSRSDLNTLLGTHAYETGDYKAALQYSEMAISFARKSLKFQQGGMESLLWLAGEVNILCGKRQRGTELLLEVVDYITKIYGTDHLKTRNSRERMQRILELSTES